MSYVVFILCLLMSVVSYAESEWELSKEDTQRNIQVYVRPQETLPYHEFYAQTIVPQPIETVIAVLADISAWPQWLARIKKVQILKKQENQSWVYVIYKLPYPFVERDTVLYARLTKHPKTSIVTIQSNALPNYPLPPDIVIKRVRLNNLSSTWRLTPLPTGGTKIELTGRGEPGGFMPSLIFNYNLADEAQQTVRLLRQMLIRPQYAPKSTELHQQIKHIRHDALHKLSYALTARFE
jgi:ribosome-associated toxin RatA of RatAB toxin-antitoxin module